MDMSQGIDIHSLPADKTIEPTYYVPTSGTWLCCQPTAASLMPRPATTQAASCASSVLEARSPDDTPAAVSLAVSTSILCQAFRKIRRIGFGAVLPAFGATILPNYPANADKLTTVADGIQWPCEQM
jgi:hypothetical protein